MSTVKDGLLYTKDDEWIAVNGATGAVGITDYAQDSLSDIVYLELPNVGDSFESGENFGVVESVKAAADLFMPVSGQVTAVNDALIDAPEEINQSPYDAWLVKIQFSDLAELDELMDADAYRKYLAERD
ncbi:MAG: glycine cleavage system protein GcvH [Chloroflexi bacterium]|nr:glycine cleavage system protein GcvH [Chloroflexota bacterium]MBP7041614.1 glycine cleavage system protein GcvH [Chloroflexota bacterium]